MRFERIVLDEQDENVYLDAYVADHIDGYKRKAILIIPGGGYIMVCSDREGEPIAHEFLSRGYNAFVLHYSVGERDNEFPKQLIEASKAMKHIKDNKEEYDLDDTGVFAIGFSAGGHLAGCLGILWDNPQVYKAIDMPKGYNRPDGVMLIYPVVSSDKDIAHVLSFNRLLGCETPPKDRLLEVSLEKHVNESSSPAFILHTFNDQTVPVKNSLCLANAYVDAGVPCELHIYPDAPHGVALSNDITACGLKKLADTSIAKWVDNAVYWANNLNKKDEE